MLIGCGFFVLVLVAIIDGFRKTVILVGRVVPGIEIAELLLDLFDLRLVLLLLTTRLLKLLLQLLKLRSIQGRRSLLDIPLCSLDLKPHEVTLILFPFARIVDHHHCDRDDEQQQAGDGEPFVEVNDFVEPVVAFLDIQRRNLLCRRRYGRLFVAALIGSFAAHNSLRLLASGPPLGLLRYTASRPLHYRSVPPHGYMLKKYSGIPMMYFRLKSQRSTILIGSAVMHSRRNVMIWNRMGPSV